jgi:hypothetical protein
MYIYCNFLQNTNFWANVWQKRLFYYTENIFQNFRGTGMAHNLELDHMLKNEGFLNYMKFHVGHPKICVYSV